MKRLQNITMTVVLTFALVFLCTLVFTPPQAVAAEIQNTGKVLLLTDIHFNPFADSTLIDKLIAAEYNQWEKIFLTSNSKSYGTYGQETDFTLFNSVLKAIHKIEANPDFIIMSGDILAHKFNATFAQYSKDQSMYSLYKFIYKTMGFVSWKLSQYYHHVPVYFALGNNDSYTGDYSCIPDGEFMHTTADLFFQNFIKDAGNRESFYATYPVNGYYTAVPPKAKNARIIVLNTNYFSPKGGEFTPDPAQQQLSWLEAQLAASQKNGERVWIIGHIPAGVDVFSTVKSGESTVTLQWKENYIDQYIKDVQTYGANITASFAGHTHMDDFRLVYDADHAKPAYFMHITPSITPVFSNNSAFQLLMYNWETFSIDNFVTYYLDLKSATDKWAKEYTFNDAYQQTRVTAASLGNVLNALQNDAKSLTTYVTNYSVNTKPPLIEDYAKEYVMGIEYLTPAEFLQNYK